MELETERFDALTFDVYGTLIDWEPTIGAMLADWAAGTGVEASHEDLLQAFDDARAHYQTLRPALLYPDVLRSAFAYVCDRWRRPVDRDRQEAFAGSVGDWQPFDDTVAALGELKARFKLGALSNIDEASFRKTEALLGEPFDFVVTAERVEAYKPSLPHFAMALHELGRLDIPLARLLHVCQSLRADVRPANDLGITSVWINRSGRGLGLVGHGAELARPDAEFANLRSFADHDRCRRGA